MKKQYLEAGKIVNTHGIRGEVRIQPWTSEPDFLCSFKKIYIDGEKYKLKNPRVQKECIIASIDGVSTIDDAILLKNKIIYIDRKDAKLDKDEFFVQDLIGLPVLDADTGKELGTLKDVLPLPAGDVYEVSGEREILIPAVPQFIIEKNVDAGYIKVRLIEGM